METDQVFNLNPGAKNNFYLIDEEGDINKLLLPWLESKWQNLMDIQVSLSTSSGTKESISAETSSKVVEETAVTDENDKETTLGDALNSVKDTSLASVEELQNLAGGADIKVHLYL